MGLIKAAAGAVGGTLADQWKEFFYCDALDKSVLAVKGQKRTSSRSSNTKGNDNIISNGSGIAVADGQCMMIVEQGKVVEFCAEPGEFTCDSSTEPSIFTGGFGKGLLGNLQDRRKRFTYGGDTGKDQRVYYFNTKEIIDNKFGTANPIPFRVVDCNIGLDIDVSVRCNGVYSYKISDPMLFYVNVCGNVEQEYTRDEIDSQLKAEFMNALQPAMARISEMEIRPNAIPAHAGELSDFMNQELTKKWSELRGLEVVSIALNPITLPDGDAAMIKQAQRDAINRNPNMAAATLVRCSGRGPCVPPPQNEGRCHERLYRHGNGFKCRRSKRPIPFCHGDANRLSSPFRQPHPPKTHGNVPAEPSHRATSAPNAEQNARRRLEMLLRTDQQG